MTANELKQSAALAALNYVPQDAIIGVGTGSTANFFIDGLANLRTKIKGAVASSQATAQRLEAYGIPLFDLNDITTIPVYIDGADEINSKLHMIKGGGGALTREKIVAAVSQQFVCICDNSKKVEVLGKFSLPIEVIPMAQAYVMRELRKLGGSPKLREGFVTDNGNLIVDVANLEIHQPEELEKQLNNIVGVVTNGLFAIRGADVLLLATPEGVRTIYTA